MATTTLQPTLVATRASRSSPISKPHIASACVRRCASTSGNVSLLLRRPPRTSTSRRRSALSLTSNAASSSNDGGADGDSGSEGGRRPVLIIPGFLSGADKYEGMADELRRLDLFGDVKIVPLTVADWYPTLAGSDFKRIIDKIDATAQSLFKSSSSKLLVVGHSAGGWLARCWMGSEPYSGGVVYAGGSRVDTLLTLGTPHYSLEEYPFGRVPEERVGENLGEEEVEVEEEGGGGAAGVGANDEVWNVERARGSTLALTNLRYPGAHEPGVRYVAVCGRSIRGTEFRRWRPGLPLGPVGAGVSYRASCGAAEVEGDGVTPVETAMLEGAKRVVLDGVLHQPGPGRGLPSGKDDDVVEEEDRWYGSKSVVALWAPLLLESAAEGVTRKPKFPM